MSATQIRHFRVCGAKVPDFPAISPKSNSRTVKKIVRERFFAQYSSRLIVTFWQSSAPQNFHFKEEAEGVEPANDVQRINKLSKYTIESRRIKPKLAVLEHAPHTVCWFRYVELLCSGDRFPSQRSLFVQFIDKIS